MEAPVSYKLNKVDVNQTLEGEAKAILEEKYLRLTIPFGEPAVFLYEDIAEIHEQDYKIEIITASKDTLTLEKLGYQYEDFLFQLFRLRNELLLKYSLMEESLLNDGFYAQYVRTEPNKPSQTGNCEIRLYDTAMVVLPQKNEPIRIPYCYISKISKGDYKVSVVDEFGDELVFSMLGEKFDPLIKALSDAYDKMMQRTIENIKELIPEAESSALNKLAALMKDGKATQRKKIEEITPNFWPHLIKRIKTAGLDTQINFLDSFSQKDHVYVGLKRGLMGELTGSYTWMMFPLNNHENNKLSNTIALEAFTTPEDEGTSGEKTKSFGQEQEEQNQKDPNEDQASAAVGATYFFKIMERKRYSQLKNEELTLELETFTRNLNRCMIEINFRREPIFLTETQLDNPKYTQYRYAITKIPALKTLRKLYIGKIIHSSPAQWQSDVTNLLAFNNKSLDDNEKWKKGEK